MLEIGAELEGSKQGPGPAKHFKILYYLVFKYGIV
jgi:hypothetical protein